MHIVQWWKKSSSNILLEDHDTPQFVVHSNIQPQMMSAVSDDCFYYMYKFELEEESNFIGSLKDDDWIKGNQKFFMNSIWK